MPHSLSAWVAPSWQAVMAAAAGTDLRMLDSSHKGPQEAQLDGFQSRISVGARGSDAEQQHLYTTEWHYDATNMDVAPPAAVVALLGDPHEESLEKRWLPA